MFKIYNLEEGSYSIRNNSREERVYMSMVPDHSFCQLIVEIGEGFSKFGQQFSG